MNIFLDLDETIISSVDNDEYIENKEKLDKLNLHSKKLDEEGENFEYNVYGRPHLQTFLEFIFKNFNVSVWTAASKNYALFIIEKFILNDKERKLDYIFFDYHCSLSQQFKDDENKIKSLDILSNDFNIEKITLNNTVIIDDNPKVFKNQPNNCIKIKPFDVIKNKNPEDDNELLKIKNKLELMFV